MIPQTASPFNLGPRIHRHQVSGSPERTSNRIRYRFPLMRVVPQARFHRSSEHLWQTVSPSTARIPIKISSWSKPDDRCLENPILKPTCCRCPTDGDVPGVAAQRESAANDETARVLSLENAWNQAELRHDMSALSMLLGETFDFTDDDGRFMDKKQWLDHIRKEEDHFELLGSSGMAVHLYGKVAIATGIYRSKMGTGLLLSGRFTDTWIQRNGEWKCVASQATLISH